MIVTKNVAIRAIMPKAKVKALIPGGVRIVIGSPMSKQKMKYRNNKQNKLIN